MINRRLLSTSRKDTGTLYPTFAGLSEILGPHSLLISLKH